MKESNNINKQHGLGIVSVILIVLLVGFAAMFGVKAGPVYFENYVIKDILISMRQDEAMLRASPKKLSDSLLLQLSNNSIYSITQENIKVTTSGTERRLQVAYDVKKPFIHNIELLMTFDDTVEFPVQ